MNIKAFFLKKKKTILLRNKYIHCPIRTKTFKTV